MEHESSEDFSGPIASQNEGSELESPRSTEWVEDVPEEISAPSKGGMENFAVGERDNLMAAPLVATQLESIGGALRQEDRFEPVVIALWNGIVLV